MRALFLVPSPHENYLPPIEQIQYIENGELKGGWWCVSEAPLEHTVVLCIDSTDDMLDTLAEDPNLLYLEDIPDETQIA